MKIILIIIPIILILQSCDDKVYIDIPQDEKPLLKNNDTVYFYSNRNNNIDTFIISLTKKYEVHDKKYYHETITIGYDAPNQTYSNRFLIQQGEGSTSISAEGNYFPTVYKSETPVSVSINGTNYESVYIKHDNNFPDSIPKYVYYTHKHGIIRYDFSDTTYYEIEGNK